MPWATVLSVVSASVNGSASSPVRWLRTIAQPISNSTIAVVEEGQRCATIEVHTRFHRSASGGLLTAEATVTTAGRRIVHLEARTLDASGQLVASATGSFAVIQPPAAT